MRRKMLYIMSVSWLWIYQRPHILAQQLSGDFDVTVAYPYFLAESGRKAKEGKGLAFRRVLHIPFRERNKLAEQVFIKCNEMLVFRDIRSFDYLFIGHPAYARFIPKEYQGKIIYDCMDDHEAMCDYESYACNIRRLERFLIKRCDLLLVTSESLRKKADGIAGYPKSLLCRNGTSVESHPIRMPERKERYEIGYVGTVSKWFDFAMLQSTRQELADITYRLIGPADRTVKADNIIYEGSVSHEHLYERISDCDCLIMPFLLNKLTLSVDPVKLYEYIAFGKCIISVFYPEIRRFQDFVYFYHSTEEYVDLVKRLSREGFPAKYSERQRQAFLAENRWERRAAQIKAAIDEKQYYEKYVDGKYRQEKKKGDERLRDKAGGGENVSPCERT